MAILGEDYICILIFSENNLCLDQGNIHVQMKGGQAKKTKVRVAWKLLCRYTILFSIIFNNYSPKWR